MYARVITVQIQPGRIEEANSIYHDSVIHAAKQQKGFKSAMLMTDPATGKGISVSMWESETDQKASETSGYLQQQLTKIGTVLAGPPVREGFVVDVHS